MSIAYSSSMTAAQLERLSLPDKQVELMRGRLIVREPPGSWHGRTLSLLDGDATLDGEDVLPGFGCPLRDILE